MVLLLQYAGTSKLLTDEVAQNLMQEVLSAFPANHFSFLLSLSLSLYTCTWGVLSFILMFLAMSLALSQAMWLAPSQTNLVLVGDMIACCTHGASASFSAHIDLAHPADGDA